MRLPFFPAYISFDLEKNCTIMLEPLPPPKKKYP